MGHYAVRLDLIEGGGILYEAYYVPYRRAPGYMIYIIEYITDANMNHIRSIYKKYPYYIRKSLI